QPAPDRDRVLAHLRAGHQLHRPHHRDDAAGDVPGNPDRAEHRDHVAVDGLAGGDVDVREHADLAFEVVVDPHRVTADLDVDVRDMEVEPIVRAVGGAADLRGDPVPDRLPDAAADLA